MRMANQIGGIINYAWVGAVHYSGEVLTLERSHRTEEVHRLVGLDAQNGRIVLA